VAATNRAVVHFYNQRGTAEQWIKEGKAATRWTRLSCHSFRANEVRLLLGVIAYNLGNLLRRLALPVAIKSWSLTSLQQRLFRTGGRLIRHARYFILQVGESQLTQRLFAHHAAHRATRVAPDVIERTPQAGAGSDAGGGVARRAGQLSGEVRSGCCRPATSRGTLRRAGPHGSEGVTSPTRQGETRKKMGPSQ
jgi:Transposase DDE domain group 1